MFAIIAKIRTDRKVEVNYLAGNKKIIVRSIRTFAHYE